MQIAVDIVFGPVEHISWAGERKLIKINHEKWDNASTWFWIISLHLSLMKYVKEKILIIPTVENYIHITDTFY